MHFISNLVTRDLSRAQSPELTNYSVAYHLKCRHTKSANHNIFTFTTAGSTMESDMYGHTVHAGK